MFKIDKGCTGLNHTITNFSCFIFTAIITVKNQSIKTVKINIGGELHTCVSCGNQFKGKICNVCGEKVFHPSHLNVKHYLEQVFDFFGHFENKVIKTIWLNFIKPGFVTKENLRGVTVPYAKPVQLFVVVNLIFYFITNFLGVTDYTPNQGDESYFGLSSYSIFRWVEPADNSFVNYIGHTRERKVREIAEERNKSAIRWKDDFHLVFDSSGNNMLNYQLQARFNNSYSEKVSEYSKLLLIILVPFIALIFYLFFYKKMPSYGAALIFATHFMAYNLLIFSMRCVANYFSLLITNGKIKLSVVVIKYLFYNHYTSPFFSLITDDPFEMLHFVLWMPWLFIAFKRLFNPKWFFNLIACYFSARIF